MFIPIYLLCLSSVISVNYYIILDVSMEFMPVSMIFWRCCFGKNIMDQIDRNLFCTVATRRYVSGYKNRFQNFIRYLREMGDEVDRAIPTVLVRISIWQICTCFQKLLFACLLPGNSGDHAWRSSRILPWRKGCCILEV